MKIYHRLLLGFGSLLLLSFISLVSNIYLSQRVKANTRWFAHSLEIIQQSIAMEREVVKIQSDFRGFVLTQDSNFYQSVKLRDASVRRMGKLIQYEVRDNPVQTKRMTQVIARYEFWISFIYETTGRVQQVGDNLAGLRKEIGPWVRYRGEELMDSTEAAFRAFNQHEYRLRSLRDQDLENVRHTNNGINIGLLAISLLLGILMSYRIANDIRNRIQGLTLATERVSGGEFSYRLFDEKRDELHSLVTSFNLMTERLNKSFDEIQRYSQEMEQSAWIISHDLKEPLRSISLYTQRLERKYANMDEDGKVYVREILSAVKRMQSLMESLMDYSRLGKSIQKQREIDLQTLLDKVEQSLGLLIEESHAQIHRHDLPDKIFGVESLLSQVFQNLIQNAIKYHKEDVPPVIEIYCVSDGGYWHFKLEDNGIGISKEYWKKVFVIFQRLHAQHQYGGTGMGLAITRKVIEMHGGQIWVDSEPGEGSVFHFTLPMHPQV